MACLEVVPQVVFDLIWRSTIRRGIGLRFILYGRMSVVFPHYDNEKVITKDG